MPCMLSHFSCIQLFVTPWTVDHQAPLYMGFSRQRYCSGLPCPPPGDFLDWGIKPAFPVAPALQVNSLPLSHRGSPIKDAKSWTCICQSLHLHYTLLLVGEVGKLQGCLVTRLVGHIHLILAVSPEGHVLPDSPSLRPVQQFLPAPNICIKSQPLHIFRVFTFSCLNLIHIILSLSYISVKSLFTMSSLGCSQSLLQNLVFH